MKKLVKLLFTIIFISVVIWGCKKSTDTIAPSIETAGLLNGDIIQVSNANPDVIVNYNSTDNKELDSVRVSIVEKNSINIVAFASKRNISAATVDPGIINVSFPASAKSGQYTIVIISIDKSGNTNRKSYDINIINTKTDGCTFPNLPLPAGKNVMIRVVTEPGLRGDNVYITGDFETANGGNDWSGGNALFKMTKLAGSDNCYYIFLNFVPGQVFKFTGGDWGKVIKDGDQQEISDFRWVTTIPSSAIDFKYVTGQSIDVRIFNWANKRVMYSDDGNPSYR